MLNNKNWYASGIAHRRQDPQPTFADLFIFLFGLVAILIAVNAVVKIPWVHWLSRIEL